MFNQNGESMIFPNVRIDFFSGNNEPAEDWAATIRVEDAEMVLDLPEDAGDGPYLVRGMRVGSFYAGVNSAIENPCNVVARWAELGDVWVGWWKEEGTEYLFRFRLPKVSGRTAG